MAKKNVFTKAEQRALDSLRSRGFAVTIFNEEELAGAPSDEVEDSMVAAGWDAIELLRDEEEDEEGA